MTRRRREGGKRLGKRGGGRRDEVRRVGGGASTSLHPSPPLMIRRLPSALLSSLFPSHPQSARKAPIRFRAEPRRASQPPPPPTPPPPPLPLPPSPSPSPTAVSLSVQWSRKQPLCAELIRACEPAAETAETKRLWRSSAGRLESRLHANQQEPLIRITFCTHFFELYSPSVRSGISFLFSLPIISYCAARMQGKEASVFCTGCWRLMLLSSVLVLHLIPLIVHGNTVGTNATETESVANVTSLLNGEEGPNKVNEASVSANPDPVSTVTPRAGRIPRAGEEEDQSSGMFAESVVPAVQEEVEVGVAPPPQISPDSAETEHLIPSSPHESKVLDVEEEEEEEEERLPHTDPPWIHAKDTAVFDLDRLFTTTAPPVTNPSNPDILHVDFFDPSSRGRSLDLAPPSPSSLAHELQGGDPTSWAMPDNYDYLTPYEDGVSPTADEYTYSTTTDAYETDEDLRLAAGSPARSKPRAPASGSFNPGAALPGAGAPLPNIPVGAPPAAAAVDGSDGMGGCRVGYQMVNGSCRSPCDMLPNYCFNGGQCYLLEGMGVFCRCNVQDYIWHKGARCESVVTEFQVMCLAVGASALVVLLLFMIIVCFAKKLHVLKTENKKLRKRSSKYRPTSETHNDNFSLSTIAEGSHPNVRKLCDTPPNVPHARALAYYDNIICQDDPNSQNKLEDPVKAPPKEDDSLNIHNSLTPKHENHKVLGEENSSEVNSLQNNMM